MRLSHETQIALLKRPCEALTKVLVSLLLRFCGYEQSQHENAFANNYILLPLKLSGSVCVYHFAARVRIPSTTSMLFQFVFHLWC